jgi:hypothetical protein
VEDYNKKIKIAMIRVDVVEDREVNRLGFLMG